MPDSNPGVGPDGEGEAPIVRDRRRFDPSTGERRTDLPDEAPQASPVEQAADAGSTDLVAELTADLQRVQAEYANYRRRVDRDREAVGEAALVSVIFGLLPVLDDLDRARAHGEVQGGFALVADGLEATLAKLGLARFGDVGEPFDPTIHEALTHGLSGEVSEPVCAEVYQPGFRVGERILRPARVAVLEPESAPGGDVPQQTDASAE
ncbi:MAG TPA: nucleotide exchange factor GrpE [Mycobacteriales bacterium]|jgi:molecular chaperone GrpE|nr:nucleotide exchange factor GrpE [Mycobacteriales bacterium]